MSRKLATDTFVRPPPLSKLRATPSRLKVRVPDSFTAQVGWDMSVSDPPRGWLNKLSTHLEESTANVIRNKRRRETWLAVGMAGKTLFGAPGT